MQFFSTIAALVACASAYTVLTPTSNSTIAKGSAIDVKWSSVDTDASTFSIYLVNFQTAHWPPTVLSLAQNVNRDDGVASVRIPCSVSSDYGWQLNFINGTNTYVIYAQSPMFSLTGDCVDPITPVPSSPTYANASAGSVVQTIIYNNPVVWFVQPNNLVAAAAICPPASQQTVTVQAGSSQQTVTVQAPASTVTVASCPSQAAIVAAIAAAAAGQPSSPAGAASAATASAIANGTTKASASVLPAVSKLPVSTSGAVKVGGAAAGLIGAFAVLLL